ncbi:hypothetical protein EDB83DRAFT_2557825 [Lactarius deliciosus]|nr:hypothetical protein EDB83DRAFT_2557825 [Lactarius deliciosus]
MSRVMRGSGMGTVNGRSGGKSPRSVGLALRGRGPRASGRKFRASKTSRMRLMTSQSMPGVVGDTDGVRITRWVMSLDIRERYSPDEGGERATGVSGSISDDGELDGDDEIGEDDSLGTSGSVSNNSVSNGSDPNKLESSECCDDRDDILELKELRERGLRGGGVNGMAMTPRLALPVTVGGMVVNALVVALPVILYATDLVPVGNGVDSAEAETDIDTVGVREGEDGNNDSGRPIGKGPGKDGGTELMDLDQYLGLLRSGLRDNFNDLLGRLRGSDLDGLFYEQVGSNWGWLFDRLGDSLNFLVNGPKNLLVSSVLSKMVLKGKEREWSEERSGGRWRDRYQCCDDAVPRNADTDIDTICIIENSPDLDYSKIRPTSGLPVTNSGFPFLLSVTYHHVLLVNVLVSTIHPMHAHPRDLLLGITPQTRQRAVVQLTFTCPQSPLHPGLKEPRVAGDLGLSSKSNLSSLAQDATVYLSVIVLKVRGPDRSFFNYYYDVFCGKKFGVVPLLYYASPRLRTPPPTSHRLTQTRPWAILYYSKIQNRGPLLSTLGVQAESERVFW